VPAEIRRESTLPPVTKTRLALALLAMTLGLAAIFPALDHDTPRVSDESGMIAALIGMQQGRLKDRPHDGRFKFPQDHGNHAEYPGESWRITGNLRDQTGRRFGLEFGIMRLAFGGKGTPKPCVGVGYPRGVCRAAGAERSRACSRLQR